jgi:hypothetical protein
VATSRQPESLRRAWNIRGELHTRWAAMTATSARRRTGRPSGMAMSWLCTKSSTAASL